MDFANSLLLWTAVGAAVPLFIHLLSREKPREITIPTVQFIIDVVEKSSNVRKFNNILLLLIRMLILLGLTLLIANPTIKHSAPPLSGAPVYAVVILDNSFYTSQNINSTEQTLLIKNEAHRIVNSLPEGSHISLLSIEDSMDEFTQIKDYIRDKIDQLTLSPSILNIHENCSLASALLSSAPSNINKRLYLISDMNKGGWNNNYKLSKEVTEKLQLIPIPARQGNIFVEDVKISNKGLDNHIYANNSILISSAINGDRSLTGLKVKFIVDNEVVDEKKITGEEQSAMVTFHHAFNKSGTHFCTISIDSKDGIEEDNTFYFTIHVSPPAKVLIASDGLGHNSFYYKAALAPSGWHGQQKFDVEEISYNEIHDRLQQQAVKTIILGGSMNLNEKIWGRIKKYVIQGGSLIICPDEHTSYESLNRAAPALFQSKIVPLKGSLSLLRSSQSSFAKKIASDSLKSVRIQQAATFEEEIENSQMDIVLRYNNTKPALLINTLELGEAVFWGISPYPKHSNFLQSDSFALVWHILVQRFSGSAPPQKNFFYKEQVEVRALQGERNSFSVRSPSGTVDHIPKENFSINSASTYSSIYDQTLLPGHYNCSSIIFGGFSCNIKRHADYYQYPQPASYEHLLTAQQKEPLSTTATPLLTSDFLQAALIVAILLMLIAEVHLANRSHYAGN